MVPEDRDIVRLNVPHEDVSERFKHFKKDFSRQFCHMYSTRLKQMREDVIKQVKMKWGEKYIIRKMSEMREEHEEKCILIGTLFKHQELKPSILKEISEENKLIPLPPRFHFVDDEDILILEDELQRIRLVGDIDIHQMATGIVCAVMGYEHSDGRFHVESMIFSDCKLQKPLSVSNQESSPKLLLLSGSSLSLLNSLSMHLFCDWLAGHMGSDRSSSIVRVVIAGNSIRNSPAQKQKSAKPSANSENATSEINELDEFLEGLCSTVPVDLMAGEFDPSNHMLPQQPLHHCLFPKAHATGALQAVTNPYHCKIGECTILGSSGQPVRSILAYTRIDRAIDVLGKTLEWRHMAPTAPDTLPCYPYRDTDPFIISELPHIYFAGNCAEFATELFEDISGAKTRLICIPEFCKTQTAALVDLDTLECIPLSFTVSD